MQLIVDMVPIDGHQVEGHVHRADMGTPLAFCGWLDFVRVLETVLRTGDATERDGLDPASGTTSNGRLS